VCVGYTLVMHRHVKSLLSLPSVQKPVLVIKFVIAITLIYFSELIELCN